MFQKSGIYLSSDKMSKPLILLGQINSHLKYVCSTKRENNFPFQDSQQKNYVSRRFFNDLRLPMLFTLNCKMLQNLGLNFGHQDPKPNMRDQKNTELKTKTEEFQFYLNQWSAYFSWKFGQDNIIFGAFNFLFNKIILI